MAAPGPLSTGRVVRYRKHGLSRIAYSDPEGGLRNGQYLGRFEESERDSQSPRSHCGVFVAPAVAPFLATRLLLYRPARLTRKAIFWGFRPSPAGSCGDHT